MNVSVVTTGDGQGDNSHRRLRTAPVARRTRTWTGPAVGDPRKMRRAVALACPRGRSRSPCPTGGTAGGGRRRRRGPRGAGPGASPQGEPAGVARDRRGGRDAGGPGVVRPGRRIAGADP